MPTPRFRSLPRRAATGLLAGTLAVLAACSDDGEAIDPDADEEVVEESVLTLDDLPEGFEQVDADDGDDSDELEDCAEEAGMDADQLEENRVVEGDPVEFRRSTDATFESVTASISSVDDTGPFEELLALFDDDDFQDCVFEALEDGFEDQGREIGGFDAEVIDAAEEGDASSAIRVEVEVDGFDAEIEQHLVLVGRFGFSVQIVTVNESVDEDLVEDALDAMIDRVEDATG